MIFLILVPLYLLVNYYIIRRSLKWMGNFTKLLTKKWFIIPYLIIYIFASTSMLVAFWLPASPFQRFMKVLSNNWLGTMLFVKDLSKNKSNIFLRINKTKWTVLKIMSIIIQFAILLAVGYLVTFTIFSLFDRVPDNTLLLYFTNLTIFILLELFILILIYGNVILKLLIGLGLILLLCFNLTRVVSMTNYIWYLVVSLIIMIIFAIMIFRRRIYKLFESEVFR